MMLSDMAAPTPAPLERALWHWVCTRCQCLKPPEDYPIPTGRAGHPGAARVSRTCNECRAELMREARDSTAEHERRRLVAKEQNL